MKVNQIKLTILLIFFSGHLAAKPVKVEGGILFSVKDAQATKNRITRLEKKTNDQAAIISAQDILIDLLVSQTNIIMDMALNRIDYSGVVLEKSEVHRHIIKTEKKRSFWIGFGAGVAGGIAIVILSIKAINAINGLNNFQNSINNTRYSASGSIVSHSRAGLGISIQF